MGKLGSLGKSYSILFNKIAPKLSQKAKNYFKTKIDNNTLSAIDKINIEKLSKLKDSTAIKDSYGNYAIQEHHIIPYLGNNGELALEIVQKYGVKNLQTWKNNLEYVYPHLGRHSGDYGKIVLKKLEEINKIAKGNKDIFFREFEKFKFEVIKNPKNFKIYNK